ncbi:MAG TPA: hypothetical protein VFH47_06810 [Candidatus Thermoplasmatota archaeon]|nr:hypothetical protein [Candidatus Thermoplasmatota archaeon]
MTPRTRGLLVAVAAIAGVAAAFPVMRGEPEAVQLVPGPAYESVREAGFLEARLRDDGSVRSIHASGVPGATVEMADVLAVRNPHPVPQEVRLTTIRAPPEGIQYRIVAADGTVWQPGSGTSDAIVVPARGFLPLTLVLEWTEGATAAEWSWGLVWSPA